MVFLLITGGIIFLKKRERFFKLISNKLFILSFMSVCIFSYYILSSDEDTEQMKKLKEATKTALIGFIIAILSYLELTVAPFWILFIFSYYLDIKRLTNKIISLVYENLNCRR